VTLKRDTGFQPVLIARESKQSRLTYGFLTSDALRTGWKPRVTGDTPDRKIGSSPPFRVSRHVSMQP